MVNSDCECHQFEDHPGDEQVTPLGVFLRVKHWERKGVRNTGLAHQRFKVSVDCWEVDLGKAGPGWRK